MTYRRSTDTEPFSSRWRISHREQLTSVGIPSEVADSDKRWAYVLWHGNDPLSGWNTSWLSGIWLIDDLQRLLDGQKSE